MKQTIYETPIDDGRNGLAKPWTIRRRIIYITLILCAVAIFYIMIFGTDTRVNEAIVLGAFGTATMVIGSYCFSAVWSDNTSKNIHMTNQRAGNNIIAPGSAFIQNEKEETPAERKQRAKERLARMKAKQQSVDNPDS